MKKIALVVAAILVIRIQGCSTDDLSNLENNKQEKEVNTDLQKNFPSCIERIYVVFPEDADEIYRSEYLQWAQDNVFSFIMHTVDPVCDNIYIWGVPCDEVFQMKHLNEKTDDSDDTVLVAERDPETSDDDVTCNCVNLDLYYIDQNSECTDLYEFR